MRERRTSTRATDTDDVLDIQSATPAPAIAAIEVGDTVRLCRALQADLRDAEQRARRLAFASAHVMTTARGIGTRACQIAERARDAELSLATSLQATMEAWASIHRSAGTVAMRDHGPDAFAPAASTLASILERVTDAANLAHHVALRATVVASRYSADGLAGNITRTAARTQQTMQPTNGEQSNAQRLTTND